MTSSATPSAHIWLVEDNPADVYLLKKALDHHHIGYALTTFSDGEAAIRAVSSAEYVRPDVILIDLRLPRRDGFDVLRVVRGHPSLYDIPIGVFTSSDAEVDRRQAEEQKADQYIYKPVEYERFVDEVGRAVKDLLTKTL